MEKHHKLRRPVGSSLHGCNICGKEGHQAALCANGTVDWATKWDKAAFVADKPHNFVEPDYEAVAQKAKEWAEQRKKRKADAENAADDMSKKESGGEGGVPAAPGVWQTFFDTFGRPYYFNAATNTTSWVAPAGVAPAVPPPMPPPGAPAAGGSAVPGPTPPAVAPPAGDDAAPAAEDAAAEEEAKKEEEPAADAAPAEALAAADVEADAAAS